MSPSIFTSFPESARGFLGNITSNFRHRSSSSPPATIGASKAPIISPSTNIFTYSNINLPRTNSDAVPQQQQHPLSHIASLSSLSSSSTTLCGTEKITDSDFEWEVPNKKRFEPGFSFHFRSRNGSAASMFTNISVSLKQGYQKQPSPPITTSTMTATTQQQHPQQQQPQQEPQRAKMESKEWQLQQQRKQILANTSGNKHAANADPPSIVIVPSSNSTRSVPYPSLPLLPSLFHTLAPAPGSVDAAAGERLDPFVNTSAPDVHKYADRGADPAATTVVEVADHQATNGAVTPAADDGEAVGEAHHTAAVIDSVANLLPETVLIRDLPEYYPDDDFGHNAKRDEKYARVRLVALREHQQVLIRLLSELLEADNQYRYILHQSQSHHGHTQDQNLVQSHSHASQRDSLIMSPTPFPSPPRSSTLSPHDKQVQGITVSLNTSQPPKCRCDCLARRTSRRQKRAAAVQGYQKAILDLWQTDQNMCHWLSRYIRTTRRVSRSLEFILVATRDECMVRIGKGVSNPELERMGILQSKLLEYVVAPARSSMAFMSTTLPYIDDVLRRSSAPMRMTQCSNDSKTIDVLSPLSTMSATANSTDRYLAPSRPLPTPPVSIHDLPPKNDSATKTTPRSVTSPILPPLSPLCPAPSTPPPAIPAPSPPGPRGAGTVIRYSSAPVTSRPQALAPIATSNTYVQPQEPQQLQQQSTNILQLQSQPIIVSKRPDGFQDFDDLEAAIFMGLHMHSVQKAKEFLNNFNKESSRSRIMVERFKVAREVYEHRVLGQPWKMMQYAEEFKRKKRV